MSKTNRDLLVSPPAYTPRVTDFQWSFNIKLPHFALDAFQAMIMLFLLSLVALGLAFHHFNVPHDAVGLPGGLPANQTRD
jgi:hypothetical protein